MNLVVDEAKFMETKSGRRFTKLNCIFPDGQKYRVTVFEEMAIPIGASITGLVEEDAPYQGKRQFKLNQPIFINGAAPIGAGQGQVSYANQPPPGAQVPPTVSLPPLASSPMPPAPAGVVGGGYAPSKMSYETHTDIMRCLLEDSFTMVEEVCLKRELEVSHAVKLELASTRATSTMIAVLRGDVEAPDTNIPF